MSRPRIVMQLAVEDLDSTEAFYAGLLGIPVQRPPVVSGAAEHLVLPLDECELIFVEESAVAVAHPILLPRLEAFPKGVGMTLHLTVSGLREIYQELMDEELEILYPLERKPYGCLELWCLDPDGYLVVLEEPLEAAS